MALEAFAKAHALLQPIQGLHAELARLWQSAGLFSSSQPRAQTQHFLGG